MEESRPMGELSLRSGKGLSASLRSTRGAAPRHARASDPPPEKPPRRARRRAARRPAPPPRPADYLLRGAVLTGIVFGAIWILFGSAP